MVAAVRDMHIMLGAVLDPHAAFLLLRGMKTLELRVQRQNATALEIARRLESHPQVTAGLHLGGCIHWVVGGGGRLDRHLLGSTLTRALMALPHLHLL